MCSKRFVPDEIPDPTEQGISENTFVGVPSVIDKIPSVIDKIINNDTKADESL